MRLRQISLAVAGLSLGALVHLLTPPAEMSLAREPGVLAKGLTWLMPAALANDVDDRIGFFLAEGARRSARVAATVVPGGWFGSAASESPREKPRRVASRLKPAADIPPVLQFPVATIFEDTTLRRGDYVMGLTGPRVFRGETGVMPQARDFVAANRVRLPKRDRALLAALSAPAPVRVAGKAQPVRVASVPTTQSAETRLEIRTVGTSEAPRVVGGVTILTPLVRPEPVPVLGALQRVTALSATAQAAGIDGGNLRLLLN